MAKFMAKCENQVLTIKPNRVQIIEGIPVPQVGERIEFFRGEFETDDKDKIKFIKEHRLFGSVITEVEKVEKPSK